ncbi:hypothetical protein U1Q18_014668 [Sarracenia purpurea var. burkii]
MSKQLDESSGVEFPNLSSLDGYLRHWGTHYVTQKKILYTWTNDEGEVVGERTYGDLHKNASLIVRKLWTSHKPIIKPGAKFTSGSIGDPKGVMVSHGGLIHNVKLTKKPYKSTSRTILVSWLPQYHDMGLIGGLFTALVSGGSTILSSPILFIKKPLLWLQIMSRYQATHSAGLNFAFELIVRRLESTKDKAHNLNLSTMVSLMVVAIPVQPMTLKRFIELTQSFGLSQEVITPGFSLAEYCLYNSRSGLFVPESFDPVRLVVIAEVQEVEPYPTEVIEQIQTHVVEEHGVAIASTVLIKPRNINKTTSRKIKSFECLKQFTNGTLNVIKEMATEDRSSIQSKSNASQTQFTEKILVIH